ncbi:23S rRNA (adenine(1618)-N(6))-methyltransferase RlmF [Ichthyenterobacterium magnum]|uniref:Ribosomal RNA large subunit methyltransferase F n=1 Tax=Ichthyenterobacterium magnum TaxID=1230530 RepID=A0A420DKX4_9FLAO|nr:23S rRNA (adenine(1618)-N(6))-methyltransferase RlmF [Ichthyenterobacterium magnum]RKE94910.1 23S rRNA (adenine1618-N6)-methyltransferase [Ichthyenterobacterium magnum]
MSKKGKKTSSNLHKKNKHNLGYNFENLCSVYPKLVPFVFKNKYGTRTVDFAIPKAVKTLNKALLLSHYNIKYWEFPDANLCPPIPGRVDYIHYLADLLKDSNIDTDSIKVLDIGTGATCIYPLLGVSEYSWSFIASDIDENSLNNAHQIVIKNDLSQHVELRQQENAEHILKHVLKPSEKISATMCNPPFFKNEKEAIASTKRKIKGLGQKTDTLVRNFSGTSKELSYKGGEKAFTHNYLYESSLYKTNCFWFTTLVSNKELVKSMYKSLKKLKATHIKTIEMAQGNKVSRVVAWTFLTTEEQNNWN